jgi:hypothetical protein
MSVSNLRQSSQENRFLVQMRLRYLGQTGIACQTVVHESRQPAHWEVKCYQNTERAFDLMQQGLSQQQISQVLWDESCREQDTIGVRTHLSIVFCTVCAKDIIQNFVGEASIFLTILTAMLNSGSLLLVTDRHTNQPFIVDNLPGDLKEQDILLLLEGLDPFT